MTIPKSMRTGNEALSNEDQRIPYSGARGSMTSNRFLPKKKEVRDIYKLIALVISSELKIKVEQNFSKINRISAFNVKLCCFSTNCIVEIKKMEILLPVYPYSIASKNLIALNYIIIHKHTNVE